MIYFRDLRNSEKRQASPIQVNSGTFKTSGVYLDRFFPKDDWRDLTQEEEEKLFHQTAPIEKSVCFLEVDPYLKKLFCEKVKPFLLSSSEKDLEELLENFGEGLIARLEQFSKLHMKSFYTREVAVAQSNPWGTAYDHQIDEFVGLHIDTHEVKAMDRRTEGFHLCTVNLGNSERYFYFSDLEVLDIIEKLDRTGKQYNYKTVTTLTGAFLSEFPDYPIYRLTIQPNEAYVAITQNILHNGGTNQKGDLDIAFLLGGFFRHG